VLSCPGARSYGKCLLIASANVNLLTTVDMQCCESDADSSVTTSQSLLQI